MTRDAIIEMAKSLCRTACDGKLKEEGCKGCPMNAQESVSVDAELYNKEETFENCTVQIWTNTYTGKTSVGWWQNG